MKTQFTPEIRGDLIKKFRLNEPIYVTRPGMPPLEKYKIYLENIWNSRWLTNNGPYHRELEVKLAKFLEVEHLNLFVNGTTALLVALQALRINSGEVITTPFTFPASTHVLHWNRIEPVFCDIDPKTFNIDPLEIETHITPETKAILGVHVYGNPCDVGPSNQSQIDMGFMSSMMRHTHLGSRSTVGQY
jgi:dTDP-4-amino-4,6-dideoxy-D-glucose transaminase